VALTFQRATASGAATEVFVRGAIGTAKIARRACVCEATVDDSGRPTVAKVRRSNLARRACVSEATVGRLRSAYRGEGAPHVPSPEGLRLSVNISIDASPPG